MVFPYSPFAKRNPAHRYLFVLTSLSLISKRDMAMASIVFTPSINQLEQRFLALLEMAIPKKVFEVCYSIGELSTRLSMPLSNVKVAVFFAVTHTEIRRILCLGDLMTCVRRILVRAGED